MKDNKKIFNEAFLKKSTYEDNKKKRLPQYTPADVSTPTEKGVINTSTYTVTSTAEVKKRLAGTYGVAFGNNNVKSMANRALKTFPIIISDNVEPESAVMLKKLLEEQYAEYINLLISNQIVNLTDFRAGNTEGNIAIQALDQISGTDFSSRRVADNAAKTGKINGVFDNIPLFQALSESGDLVLDSGDQFVNTLLEGAIVLPTFEANKLVKFMQENADEIVSLDEDYWRSSGIDDYNPQSGREQKFDDTIKWNDNRSTGSNDDKKLEKRNKMQLNKYLADISELDDKGQSSDQSLAVLNRNITRDAKRGFQGVDADGVEIYRELSTADIVINGDYMDQAINRSVGDMLTRPENVEIREKFEKAVYLLQSRRIAGLEFYQYCTLRLGIPVSDAARKKLVTNFRIADIHRGGAKSGVGEDKLITINGSEAKLIQENRKITEEVVKDICRGRLRDAIGTAGGAAVGAGVGLGVAAIASGPLFLTALAGAALGGAGYLIYRLLKKKNKPRYDGIEGWERVEALINAMDRNQAELRRINSDSELSFIDVPDNGIRPAIDRTLRNDKIYLPDPNHIDPKMDRGSIYQTVKKDYIAALDSSRDLVGRVLREAVEYPLSESVQRWMTYNDIETYANQAYFDRLDEDIKAVANECCQEKEFMAQFLSEATTKKKVRDVYTTGSMNFNFDDIVNGKKSPMAVQYVQDKDDQAVVITPQWMAADNYAYGTTEIERKENKDRRYNQPLIMTVKFRGRFNDDKFTDNELTAVIGILGKIVRVSSDEMAYILKENAEGNTIEGIFKDSKGDLRNVIGDLISGSKISKEVKNLPQSADIWHNLEKVATLAMANKISGKRSGNIANAHIIFSQKEIDEVRNELGVDYLRDTKKVVALMKRYSAITIMVANDPGQRAYIFDDADAISWNVVPYSALTGKDGGDQLTAALNKLSRL